MSTYNELTQEQQEIRDLIDSYPDSVINLATHAVSPLYKSLEECPIELLGKALKYWETFLIIDDSNE